MPGKTIFIIFILYCIILQAQTVQYNQEFQVNTYTDNNQSYPDVCGLADSGFVICWQSYGQDGGREGIYAQIFDKSIHKRGDEFRVNTYTQDEQRDPTICALSDGGFVIYWESYYSSSTEVMAQIYNSNGTRRGGEFRINSETAYEQRNPSVCSLSEGGFVVSWDSEIQDGSNYGVYGQIFENSGLKRGEEFQVNTYTNSSQHRPDICSLIDGGFVVCWESSGQDGSGYEIFGQIYDQNGIKRGDEFHVNTYTNSNQHYPSICGLSDGGFVICWGSLDQDGSGSGIFGQIFENSGIKRGEEFQINTFASYWQKRPSIHSISNGEFVVCWQGKDYSNTEYHIYAQIFNNSGKKSGIEFQLNTYIDDEQEWPSVSGLFGSGFVVCWESDEQDGNWAGIIGKYYLELPVIHLLESFSLNVPKLDASIQSIPIKFQWQKASSIHINFPWEIEYTLYIDESQDFNDPEIFSGIYDTTFVVTELAFGITYFWKVLAKNIEGDSLWSSETFGFFVSPDATQITHDPVINVQEFELFSNYPNPFNPETTIRYSLPADQSSYRVIIKIYDVLGQLVVNLREKQQRPGLYQLTWDGRNPAGQAVPSGVYFLTLEAGNFKATQKMLLVK